jgi:hypothetical protein
VYAEPEAKHKNAFDKSKRRRKVRTPNVASKLGASAMTFVKSAVFAGALIALGGSASANILYSQPFVDNAGAYSSQNDTTGGNGNFATAYDNFALGSAATITGVGFTGAYFNPPTPGTITAFTIQIYGDNGGTPGASLYSETIAGNGNEALFDCAVGTGACGNYSVSANFAAAAGTQYWLSIVPDLGFPPQWGWADGTGGDGAAYQVFFGSGAPLPTDLAFTLTSTVPEPTAWALMLIGFGGLGLVARARRATGVATA